MRGIVVGLALLSLGAPALSAQSVLDRTPNTAGVWTLDTWSPLFVFAHRFSFIDGGDALFNYPTLTLAFGLPFGFTTGLDFTSNSEIVPTNLAGNETEYWLKRGFRPTATTSLAGILAYNTAAESTNGAISVKQDVGPISLVGELRGFTDLHGSGERGAAGTVGAIGRLTPYLTLSADWGRVLGHDTLNAVWSAGAGIAIPGTPHTFSLQAATSGATTLQGMTRERVLFPDQLRYGFVFTVPLGTGRQWARIFRPAPPPPPPTEGVAAVVDMRQIEFTPRVIRIRAGQSVEWVNSDPVVHTGTATDRSWGSELIDEGERFIHRFDRPGTYEYFCIPHPMMTGVVIVED
jgi:plastocyanin